MIIKKNTKKFKDQLTEEIGDAIRTENSDQSAIAEYENLKSHAGWIRLCAEIDKRIAIFQEEILDTDVQGEELSRLRDRRDLSMWFRNFPDIIIEYLKNPPQELKNEDLDPYSRPNGSS